MKMLARLRGFAQGMFGVSGPLVLSRLASAALTFGLPLLLVRLLEPAAFGTYKQFFLIGQTLLVAGQIGLTQSLYYFLPRGGERRGAYLAQVLASLSVIGALLGAGVYLLGPQIARWMASPELAGLRLPLAIFSACMLAATPLESTLVCEGRLGKAALVYTLSDAARAGSMLLAAWLLGGRWIFWAAAGVAALRLATLWLAAASRALPFVRPAWSTLRAQLAYALPFGAASLLYIAQRYLSQYAISASFDPATFALFAVASFHMPVIDIVYTPMSEVMMVHLSRDPQNAIRHWHDSVDKLATILLPAACGAWLLGPILVPLLFTQKYAGAVPLFVLATLEMPIWILPCDALLRAAGETRFFFFFNAARLPVSAAIIIAGIHFFGLPGAILAGVVSESAGRVVLALRGRRFLQARARELLDWSGLGRIAAAAALAFAPAWAVRLFLQPGLPMVFVSAAVYAVAYFGLRALFTPPAQLAAAAA
jgi:O-antigen/teichoic acid export membrane protein